MLLNRSCLKKKYSDKYFTIFAVLSILLTSCISQQKSVAVDSIRHSVDRPIEGQLDTAERLKNLIKDGKCKEAIFLFSEARQLKIRKTEAKDKEMFNYWCNAWGLEGKAFERYRARIKNGNGIFVFENGEWRIDEN